jgi:hypothetical protein
MKLALSSLAALLLASAVQAYYPTPYPGCGSGYYGIPCYGYGCGMNQPLPPMPFNGILPPTPWANQMNQVQPPAFMQHPYARSPRDYFMISDIEEDLARRFR